MRAAQEFGWTSSVLLLLLLVSTGCQEPADVKVANQDAGSNPVPSPATSAIFCEEAHGISPVCGFRNPEDLAVVPDGSALLVSEMGPFLSDAPNTLSLLHLDTQSRRNIEFDWSEPDERWGDPACTPPDPDKFSPHGIDLITRPDGRFQVLAVNHGNEQIEFFELLNPASGWALKWMGCARPPGDPFINDVAGLADGGFFATQMWDKSLPFEAVVERLTSGEATGWVWEWQPDTGFRKVANTDELMPNGIAVNAENSKIFVNIYMGNKLIRLDRASEQVEAEFQVKSPDNIVVDTQGFLWIASHLNEPVDGRCADDHVGPCLLPFQVIRADPVTMEPEVVFTHEGEPMGYATVALPHAGRLYLGSANGDRVASLPLP